MLKRLLSAWGSVAAISGNQDYYAKAKLLHKWVHINQASLWAVYCFLYAWYYMPAYSHHPKSVGVRACLSWRVMKEQARLLHWSTPSDFELPDNSHKISGSIRFELTGFYCTSIRIKQAPDVWGSVTAMSEHNCYLNYMLPTATWDPWIHLNSSMVFSVPGKSTFVFFNVSVWSQVAASSERGHLPNQY